MKILVIAHGEVGPRMAGPAMRAWGLARVLATRHDVTVAARGSVHGAIDGIRIVPFTRTRLLREARRHDAVIGHALPPYLMLLARRRARLVSDMYDPVELELSTLPDGERRARRALAQRALQLRWADAVLCGNARQRERLASQLPRGRALPPPLLTVPMGVDPAPPAGPGSPLRERFPEIGPGDRVILWWGALWRWFDPRTAVAAAVRVAAVRPDVKLVVACGRPSPDRIGLSAADEAHRAAAAAPGKVLFLEEWVPFGERHRWLSDADVGITLHASTAEARLAMRARVLDYLWAGLPCVLAEGDEVADELAAAGFARLVAPGDVAGTAQALLELLEDPRRLADAGEAGRRLAEAWRWEAVAAPLVEALERPAPRPARGALPARLAAQVGAYYARRAGDLLAG